MRFSVVCYLDDRTTVSVRNLQQMLGELTGARASLDLWRPHVTVGDGIEVSEEELAGLKVQLSQLGHDTSAFEVTLRDILKIDNRRGGEGEDTTPYGLYLDVKTNPSLLKLVEDIANISLNLHKWYYMPSPYHPHCALAFKDLSKDGYKAGIQYLDQQNVKLEAKIDSISLVEMLPNETRKFARFELSKTTL